MNGAVLVTGPIDTRPLSWDWCRDRQRMHAAFNAVNEGELPGSAFDLPDAQSREYRNPEKAKKNKEHKTPLRRVLLVRQTTVRLCVPRSGIAGHGTWLMLWPGIMLLLRWYITHNDPVSVIPTMTRVKIRASIVQPPSDFGLICRK